jgi:hypothetical protein
VRSHALLLVVLVGCGGPTRSDPDGTGGVAGDDDPGDGSNDSEDAGNDVDTDSGVDETGPCVGVNVPGDFEYLQVALDAVAQAGEDATICLGAGTFDYPPGSDPSLVFTANDLDEHFKSLRIVGRSPAETILARPFQTFHGWGAVSLENITVVSSEQYEGISLDIVGSPPHFELRNARLEGSLHLTSYAWGDVTSIIDRCEIGTGNHAPQQSIWIVANFHAQRARVTNSILHGVVEAFNVTDDDGIELDVDLINNTFVGAEHLVFKRQVKATVANNLFAGAQDPSLVWDAGATVNSLANGNASECLLDTSGPVPILSSGSPCMGAANAALAPTYDFLGHARDAHPDIGAIEGIETID